MVDASLEAIRGVGAEPVPPRARADPRGREPCGLEQDVGGAGVDHRGRAAHDAGDRLGVPGVGDDEVAWVERPLDAIEGAQALALTRAPDHHPALGQPLAVEGVQRLAVLHQHEVGDIDDVGDRPETEAMHTDPQPQRRRPDAHALERVAEVTTAAVLGLDRDQAGVRGGDGRPQMRALEPAAALGTGGELGRDIAGDADVAERVGPVGRHTELEDRVDDPRHQGVQRSAGREVLGQDQDPIALDADLQLGLRADHALRGDAPQLSRRDLQATRQARADRRKRHLAADRRQVARAAHDRQNLLAVEQLDDGQLAGLRVWDLAADLADEDRLEAGAVVMDPLDLEAEVGEELGQLVRARRGATEVEQAGEPGVEDQHGNCSRKRTSPSNMRRR